MRILEIKVSVAVKIFDQNENVFLLPSNGCLFAWVRKGKHVQKYPLSEWNDGKEPPGHELQQLLSSAGMPGYEKPRLRQKQDGRRAKSKRRRKKTAPFTNPIEWWISRNFSLLTSSILSMVWPEDKSPMISEGSNQKNRGRLNSGR